MSGQSWWNSDSSWMGVVVMASSGFLTALIATQYFQISYLVACIVASIIAIAVGVIWNTVAHIRGTKKIHWLDFVFIDLLPW